MKPLRKDEHELAKKAPEDPLKGGELHHEE